MHAVDQKEDQSFMVNFSGDGVGRLRQQVKDKLKEFMGDDTDDTLVEYVIVLLRNGRGKDEAKKELNVFLGDDSDSFVNWLWGHLSSNLDQYVQSRSEMARSKLMSERNGSQTEQLHDNFHLNSDDDEQKSVRESRSRRNREWKGLITDASGPTTLHSSEIEKMYSERSSHRSRSDLVNRPHSPKSSLRKRKLQTERQPMKREVNAHPAIGASRRLLQCAVRDAVGTCRLLTARPQPVKRLRSVVSSLADSFVDERPKKVRSVASVPHAAAAAIKAAAEAAEDVLKVRSSGSVFNRLGCSAILSDAVILENDNEMEDQMPAVAESECLQGNGVCEDFEGNMDILEEETAVSASTSDNDGYEDVDMVGRRVADASQTATSGNEDENSLTVQYNVAKDTNDLVRNTRVADHDRTSQSVANASRKIVNISVNVNTWKPPHYKVAREITESDRRMPVQESEPGSGKPEDLIMEKNIAIGANDNEMVHAVAQKGFHGVAASIPASYSTVRPLEDAVSRTIFISNVHFAATKDMLSRHFNKFGEVLKVIILTDAATGKPKGSAYIEFIRKEAAEHALSLNGTSFMSRILKVVRRGSINHETMPMLPWTRMPRASSFTARLARVPFPRAVSSAFRSHLHVKPGPRSLRWKRDTVEGGDNVQNGTASITPNALSLTPRKLTYVRPEIKQHGNIGSA